MELAVSERVFSRTGGLAAETNCTKAQKSLSEQRQKSALVETFDFQTHDDERPHGQFPLKLSRKPYEQRREMETVTAGVSFSFLPRSLVIHNAAPNN